MNDPRDLCKSKRPITYVRTIPREAIKDYFNNEKNQRQMMQLSKANNKIKQKKLNQKTNLVAEAS